MKKMLFIALFAICGLGTANAQGFSGGITLGLPVGDASNFSSFAYGVDLNYMLDSDSDFSYGLATGYLKYSEKDGWTSSSIIPLAAAGRYSLSDKFSLGADIGYGIATESGATGGFYYRPMLVYSLSEKMSLNASYSGISSEGSTISNIGIGIMFGF